MPEIGQTILHYKILEKIGVGGMAEVYLAEDLSLDRKVALKFLPDVFTGDPERMARFEREAKLLASQNHPNIAAIYGLEQADGKHFLIMEYVEGETLQAMLRKGALPVEDALEVCRQIAEGLEAAHEKGVIHRDLKPANVMITGEEKVKILDFGLAKALADEVQSVDSSQSPTITEEMTQPGVVLGTAAYMSPEQAKGKSVDKRADIWAFGCILYEILTAQRLFSGESTAEIFAAIYHKDPDWNALPPKLHPRIRFLLERCLEKNTKDRCHSMADARVDIQKVLAHPDYETIAPAAELIPVGLGSKVGWLAAMLLGIIVVGLALWIAAGREAPSFTRLDLALPSGHTLRASDTPVLAISPDGGHVAFFSSERSQDELHLRAADELEAKAVPGSKGGSTPFFSWDGKWLAFFADGKLRKVPVAGGRPQDICSAASNRGAIWMPDDQIIFAPEDGPLMRVPSWGGAPEPITRLDASKGEISHRWPDFLPGGYVIFTVGSGGSWDDAEIAVQSLETSERHTLIGGTHGRYVPTGHLAFARNGTLMAAPFAPAEIRITGDAVPVVENVAQSAFSGVAQYAFSDTGTLVYNRAPPYGLLNLAWVDRDGSIELLGLSPGPYSVPRVSPDGTRIAVEISGANDQIGVYDLRSGVLEQITFESLNQRPVWSWDGRRVTFQSNREEGLYNLYWMVCDRSQEAEALTKTGMGQIPGSWSSDQVLAFSKFNSDTGSDIWIVRPGEAEIPFLIGPSSETDPVFSPDGNWLAYVSNEEGRSEVYVTSFPKPGAKIKISNEGGTNPIWSRSGTELFYQNGDRMMVVEVNGESGFRPDSPRLLFEMVETISGFGNTGPDGRFASTIRSSLRPANHISVALEWFEELKERVPE